VSFFFESKGKKTDRRERNRQKNNIELVVYYSQVTRRRRGIPSSFLAHLYALVIKNRYIIMGIKGLPEQLKHYYRDAQVEQFKGMSTHF
jgi:glutamate synthase domain-containing protein 1|tara:strand:- start:1987 stop:2253 length:267 start_codon:yes stop_codon:yes gene_type:complete